MTALWSIPQPVYAADRLAQLRATLDERLRQIATEPGRIVQMASLAVEDMVISEVIARLNLAIDIVAIDTGRLHGETLALADVFLKRFGRPLHWVQPDATAVADFSARHGLYPMYESLELRHACCHLRKVEPLNRVLAGASVWLTGQRRSQALTRHELTFVEADRERAMKKFNPIFDFSEDDVWAYVHAEELPINALYHQGYPSIGCEPCTIAVRAGEDIRSGRWSWERADKRECGLHTHKKEAI